MAYIPLKTVKLFATEFEKNLKGILWKSSATGISLPSIFLMINELFPELHLHERCSQGEGDAYDVRKDVLEGKYDNEERSSYLKPVNKWVSEELVYSIKKTTGKSMLLSTNIVLSS